MFCNSTIISVHALTRWSRSWGVLSGSSRFHCKSSIRESDDLSRQPGKEEAVCIPDVNLHPATARHRDTLETQETTGQKTLTLEKVITSQLWLQHKNHNVKKLKFPSLMILYWRHQCLWLTSLKWFKKWWLSQQPNVNFSTTIGPYAARLHSFIHSWCCAHPEILEVSFHPIVIS